MCKSQIIESLLKKIFQTVERILANSETITSPSFYLLTPSGMERLESTCMLLIAIGEGVKGVDKLTDKKLVIDIKEVKRPDKDAQLVAENIALQLENRVSFRRAMKSCMGRTMKSGAKGIKTSCSGRLGGADMARTEFYS